MAKAVRQLENVATTRWSNTQAYTLAAVCLLLGLALGFLLRGSAPLATTAGAAASVPAADLGSAQIPGMGGMPGANAVTPEQVDKAAQPLLDAIKRNPKNGDALTKLGNMYFDAKIYNRSIEYYEQALKIAPGDANVRTDMGTAYFYAGNADRALAEFEKALSYSPNHAQTLFNMGIVKSQGKSDAKGAIAVWEKLLQTNPGYPERQNVEEMIGRAKEQMQR